METFKLKAIYVKKESQDGIEHAVLQSILNWSKATKNDPIESNQSKQGWWGNEYLSGVGCRDWTLARSKQTNDTLKRAKRYTEQALQWLIDANLATKIDITTSFNNDRLIRSIKITLTDQTIMEISL